MKETKHCNHYTRHIEKNLIGEEDGNIREILFRGKTKRDGTWTYGHLVKHEEFVIIDRSSGAIGFGQQVIPNTIGQFTGFTDCGGHKLFERDIVTAKFKSNGARFNFKIVFLHGAFMFDNGAITVPFDHIRSVVKKGNIYDNPELWRSRK